MIFEHQQVGNTIGRKSGLKTGQNTTANFGPSGNLIMDAHVAGGTLSGYWVHNSRIFRSTFSFIDGHAKAMQFVDTLDDGINGASNKGNFYIAGSINLTDTMWDCVR